MLTITWSGDKVNQGPDIRSVQDWHFRWVHQGRPSRSNTKYERVSYTSIWAKSIPGGGINEYKGSEPEHIQSVWGNNVLF